METQQCSRTAIITAAMRASHMILDASPHVLEDHFALQFAGFKTDKDLIDFFSGFKPMGFEENRAYFSMRHRFAEDELSKAIKSKNINQYVILGAGLDSFAYRNSTIYSDLKIFEVDHPDSQQGKKERLSSLQIKIPPNVQYVPVDFEQTLLSSALSASGVSFQNPVFISWLGVTLYLSSDSVFSLLSDLSDHLSAGSIIVFDYILPDSLLNKPDKELTDYYSRRAAEVGEPWLSRFDPMEIEKELANIGYSTCKQFTKSMAIERYFKNRTDNLMLPGYPQLIVAIK